MGGYSECCPVCGKWWIKGGINDHFKAKHPELHAFWHNERYGGKPGRGIVKMHYSVVPNYGREDPESAPDPQ